ncbi:MAG: hypothetical protein ACRDIC_18890, partial [bacterium]
MALLSAIDHDELGLEIVADIHDLERTEAVRREFHHEDLAGHHDLRSHDPRFDAETIDVLSRKGRDKQANRLTSFHSEAIRIEAIAGIVHDYGELLRAGWGTKGRCRAANEQKEYRARKVRETTQCASPFLQTSEGLL